MTDFSVLMVFMMLNGQPAGPTMQIVSLDRDCRSELAAVSGLNASVESKGIHYVASCEIRNNGR